MEGSMEDRNGLNFSIQVDESGYSVETNMTPTEVVFWLDILHSQYVLKVLSDNNSV